MLVLNIGPVLSARGIERPFSFLVKSGFSSHTAHLLLHNQRHTFRLDHIELLCKVLLCEPHDLLQWTPNTGENLPATHPLYKLKRSQPVHNWKQAMSNMSLEELQQVAKSIAGKIEE
jgi:DNA-binding Xre family transcriptional regulator